MNAIQPSRNTLQPLEPRRVASQKKSRPRRYPPYRAIALETTAKLAVNIVISTAAVTALIQLVPYHLSQQQKLREVRAEVKQIEKRVNRLQSEFSRYFDPQQAKNIMQEQSHRVDPTQRQVFWLDRDTNRGEEAAQSP